MAKTLNQDSFLSANYARDICCGLSASSTDSLSNFSAHNNVCYVMNNFYVYAIDTKIAQKIQDRLNSGADLILPYDESISITASISWYTNSDLTIRSKYNISIQENVIITNLGSGTLRLMAGMETDDHASTVSFADNAKIVMPNGGKVKIYYNPIKGENFHKYHSPQSFDDVVIPGDSVKAYMLVNDQFDLSAIRYFPSMDYALSNNIAPSQKFIMKPVGNTEFPFTGSFDGNDFAISNIVISGNDYVGLFGLAITGGDDSVIENFKIHSSAVKGSHYVGAIAGVTESFKYYNIQLAAIKVEGNEMVGGVFGVMKSTKYANITGFAKGCTVTAREVSGLFAAVLVNTKIPEDYDLTTVGKVYQSDDMDEEF